MWTLANPIKHAANEKDLVTNINSNNLVPSFVGVDARMHIHRPGSGLRLDPAALCGTQRPRGGGPAASHGQGAGGRADERWPGASAVGDRPSGDRPLQFEFKMQIKLHVFCKGNIHIL